MEDLDKCKNIALTLFDVLPIKTHPVYPFLLDSHVFIKEKFYPYHGNIVDITTNDAARAECVNQWKTIIMNAGSVDDLFCLVQEKYQLTFMSYIRNYVDNTTFSKFLHDAWLYTENGNQDVNVDISEITTWFEDADKSVLMSKEDYAYYKKLPQVVTIYRGVSQHGTYYGMSWTDDREKAEWFRNRFNGYTEDDTTYLLTANVSKDDILAYFNDRDERELVVNIEAIKDGIVEI